MSKVVLIGAGGHSRVIQDIVKLSKYYELYAVLDDAIHDQIIDNGVIFANTKMLSEYSKENVSFCIAIGNNSIRRKLVRKYDIPTTRYATLIHPSAVITKDVEIGYGSVIMANATINACTKIGSHSIINTNSVVEHDNNLAEYTHISPGAILAGAVSVGEGTHIGAGATVIPNQKLGKWVTIGAGATVVNDIEDYTTSVGTPAKVIKRNEMR